MSGGEAGEAAAAADATGPPALQVIVLGSGGGPLENNVTAFLVRSLASGWGKNSLIAVDAGVHLGAIKTILERTQPASLGERDGPSLPHTLTAGPFAGLQIPHATADANAAYIHKDLIETYLITHPHLDHISGFVINTAGLSGQRPKRVAGLPSTIEALKTHVFNNVIWPNLSDENNGAGLVTYARLVDGGSPALGEGEGRGYLELCGHLTVKVLGVSHGHCIEKHSHRGSSSTRHGSFDASIAAILQQHERMQIASPAGRRGSSLSCPPAADESTCVYDSSVYFIRDGVTGREILIFGDVEPDSVSLSPRNRQVWQAAAPKIAAGNLAGIFIECSYDDSRCMERLFGHLTPRYILEEMTALAEEVVAVRRERGAPAPGHGSSGDKKRKRAGDDGALTKKKSTPQLRASREPRSDVPLSPRSLRPCRPVSTTPDPDQALASQELPGQAFPFQTRPLRRAASGDPSTPRTDPDGTDAVPTPDERGRSEDADLDVPQFQAFDLSPTATTSCMVIPTSNPHRAETAAAANPLRNALKGLRVVVIHVKERMADGPTADDVILRELQEHERKAALGVEYLISSAGQDYFF
ncbi:uncharacterized protein THITE_121750 [Thermothielavioides terrestris NRRL 8126]|uniref:3',5'-cyclic-nucleotide phosphodiesterase n=1 Tax=Thermothielavioides terrestris (strain ATCC 38088 / NRRL 8126) TaxID=578455 RepID=G2RB61_THETT|nr:uncharacterized protein THITE_121750 [Thermothielavioides terrestris NRRL 8126]AEO69032.1 hypothetical protein THITE_121750 [Thermothielavioides terrestris NRRL 8126]